MKFCLTLSLTLLILPLIASAGPDRPTTFTNTNSVASTRHNLTQRDPQRDSTQANATGIQMDPNRNNYGEVCVYCHTPHGANSTTRAPLWNRTMLASTTYTTYTSMSIEGNVGTPGANSLTCLSCHDGKVAVDSIINMPGSGKYLKSQETSQDNGFLNDKWTNSTIDASAHAGLNETGCLVCHSNEGMGATIFVGSHDFTAFALGTDLSNDHPIGVLYRGLTAGTDYNGGTSATSNGKLLYFDTDGDARPDKDEVRFYNTGGGYEVECASCHDPHGVPTGALGSQFKPTFLRVSNSGSALCLTCHAK